MSGYERAWCLIIAFVVYVAMLVTMGQYERFCITYAIWMWVSQD